MNFETEVVNVSDEEDVQTLWMPRSLERQTLVFRDDNANVGTTPFVNSNSPRTRACKLHGMQGKPNKKLERKRRRLSTSSSTIAHAINNFTHVVKEIELKKWRRQNSSHFKCCKVKRMTNNDDTRSIVVGCFVCKCVEAKDHRW
jgi:hypothetical protein